MHNFLTKGSEVIFFLKGGSRSTTSYALLSQDGIMDAAVAVDTRYHVMFQLLMKLRYTICVFALDHFLVIRIYGKHTHVVIAVVKEKSGCIHERQIHFLVLRAG